MSDPVITTREIDLTQLTAEAGVALAMASTGDEKSIFAPEGDISTESLALIINAHIPRPPPPTEGELLQSQIDELTDFVLSL